jgi:hypothetical protein
VATTNDPIPTVIGRGSKGDGTILGQSGEAIGFYGAVTPVLQATGFGTPTGVARLSNFPGATATLAQTSGALADLLTLLKSLNLIAA